MWLRMDVSYIDPYASGSVSEYRICAFLCELSTYHPSFNTEAALNTKRHGNLTNLQVGIAQIKEIISFTGFMTRI